MVSVLYVLCVARALFILFSFSKYDTSNISNVLVYLERRNASAVRDRTGRGRRISSGNVDHADDSWRFTFKDLHHTVCLHRAITITSNYLLVQIAREEILYIC